MSVVSQHHASGLRSRLDSPRMHRKHRTERLLLLSATSASGERATLRWRCALCAAFLSLGIVCKYLSVHDLCLIPLRLSGEGRAWASSESEAWSGRGERRDSEGGTERKSHSLGIDRPVGQGYTRALYLPQHRRRWAPGPAFRRIFTSLRLIGRTGPPGRASVSFARSSRAGDARPVGKPGHRKHKSKGDGRNG